MEKTITSGNSETVSGLTTGGYYSVAYTGGGIRIEQEVASGVWVVTGEDAFAGFTPVDALHGTKLRLTATGSETIKADVQEGL